MVDPDGMRAIDWLKYRDMYGDLHVDWVDKVVDQKSALDWATSQGQNQNGKQKNTDVEYIGKTGIIQNGYKNDTDKRTAYQLNDNGTSTRLEDGKSTNTAAHSTEPESSPQQSFSTDNDLSKGIEATKTILDAVDNTALKSMELGGKFGKAKVVENFAKKASSTLAGAGALLTVVDAAANGVQMKHGVDAALLYVSVALPVTAPFIFVANLVCMGLNNGKGISETIQETAAKSGVPTQYTKPAF